VNKKRQEAGAGGKESKSQGEKERKGAKGREKRALARWRKNCKSAMEGRRLWGCWRSAVVHCKSPSTAFNYDVIANTDDGYFLRYTLYITRGPIASPARPRAKGRKISRV